MKRPIACTVMALLLAHMLSAQDSISRYTGTYRSVTDSSFYFNVKMEKDRLVLELPGQGQTALQPQGNHRFVPEHVKPATVVAFATNDTCGMQMQWIQDLEGQLVKNADPKGSAGYAGMYQLKGNPYVTISVTEQQQNLVAQQGSSMPLTMHPVAKDEYEYEKDGFRLRYVFVRNAQGTIDGIKLKRTGPQLFVRQQGGITPPYGGRNFMQRKQFTRADSLQGYLYPERSCYDVLFYSLDVRVKPESKSVAGSNTIRFKAVQPFQRMQIDLFQSMKIDRLLYHDQPLTYTREYNAVFIDLPRALQPGAIDSITIHYGGQPRQPDLSKWQGGFFWLFDKEGNPWIQSVCQGAGASLWWPCKDHLSDEPDSMRMAVTVPDSLIEVSNGKLLGMTEQPGNLMRYEWYVHYPINIYNVAINLGKFGHYAEIFVNGKDTMPLHFYYISYNQQLAKKIFKTVQPMLRLYERKFGKYPFQKDGFTIMEGLYPMEHQGAVSVGPFHEPFNSDKYDTTEITRLIWHEAAHEWWGNSVSCKDNADIWFHEAFATYSEFLCVEAFQGKDIALEKLRKEVADNREPLIGIYDVNDFHLGDLYSKGPRLLHTLRKVIDNDAKFYNLLLSIQQHFTCKTISSKELEAFISRKAGMNLSPFFDQYLRHKSLPELQVEYLQGTELRYRWKADVPAFNMPVNVMLGNDGFTKLFPTTQWKTLRVASKDNIPLKVNKDEYYILTSIKK